MRATRGKDVRAFTIVDSERSNCTARRRRQVSAAARGGVVVRARSPLRRVASRRVVLARLMKIIAERAID